MTNEQVIKSRAIVYIYTIQIYRLCFPNRSLFSEGCWEVVGKEGEVETSYFCLVRSAKLHKFANYVTMDFFSRNVKTRMIKHLFIKFVYEFVTKASFSITQLNINRKE